MRHRQPESRPPSPLSPAGAVALVVSYREAARLLGVDRSSTLYELIRRGELIPVPWGNRWRIPLRQIEALAARGWSTEPPPRPARRRPYRRKGSGGAEEAQRIRDIKIEP